MKRKGAIYFFVLGLVLTVLPLALMYRLDFWGHLPLLLFAGFSVILGTALFKHLSKFKNGKKLFQYSLLSGLFLGCSFPPMISTPLVFIGFVPLLFLEKITRENHLESSRKIIFLTSYFSFFLWNSLSTFWVTNTAFVAGIFAIGANSFLMTLPVLLYHWISVRMPSKWNGAAFLSSWIVFEFLHFRWEITWPWLTLGNSLSQWPSLIQWYEYTGVLGGSFWILLINFLIFNYISKYQKTNIFSSVRTVRIMACSLLPVIISLCMYFMYQPNDETVKVAIIQPNYDPHYIKFTLSAAQALDEISDLCETVLSEDTDYLILPETVFDNINIGEINRERFVRRFRGTFSKFDQLKVISGVSGYQLFNIIEEDKVPRTYRILDNPVAGNNYYEVYNAAVEFGMQEGSEKIYRKSVFVPGAEIFPYSNVLFFLSPLIKKLGGSVQGFAGQEERTVFDSGKGRLAPIICYESVFGEFTSAFIKNGANALVIMTNDGWWDNTAGHKQHLQYSILRAIETRKGIARAANTGISAIINSKGQIVRQLDYEEKGAVVGELELNETRTFYSFWGDIIGRLSFYLLLLIISFTLLEGYKRKLNNTKNKIAATAVNEKRR